MTLLAPLCVVYHALTWPSTPVDHVPPCALAGRAASHPPDFGMRARQPCFGSPATNTDLGHRKFGSLPVVVILLVVLCGVGWGSAVHAYDEVSEGAAHSRVGNVRRWEPRGGWSHRRRPSDAYDGGDDGGGDGGGDSWRRRWRGRAGKDGSDDDDHGGRRRSRDNMYEMYVGR